MNGIYAERLCLVHTHKLALLLSPAAVLHLARTRSTHQSAMETISATTVFVAARPPSALGLPRLPVARDERLRCRCGKKASSPLAPMVAKGLPLLAAASARAASVAPMLTSALALADERMSTEGTRMSNDLLGWVLLVAFCLVLCFYNVYSSTFDDDDHSGGGGIAL